MTIIVCGQEHILPDACVECQDPLPADGGIQPDGPRGWRFCSEDCAADQQERVAQARRRSHLLVRDLLCACPVCRAAGLPSDADRAEFAAYLNGRPVESS